MNYLNVSPSNTSLGFDSLLRLLEEKTQSFLNLHEEIPLKAVLISSPLGDMIGVGDDESLYFLGFLDQRHLMREMLKLVQKTRRPINQGTAPMLDAIRCEIARYFEGKLTEFKTPLMFLGTAFQNQVWSELKSTRYATTRSYLEEAIAVGRPNSYRAVANANGANPFVIIIPCHRIIAADGTLGGYGGGLPRKEWLLAHEKRWIPS